MWPCGQGHYWLLQVPVIDPRQIPFFNILKNHHTPTHSLHQFDTGSNPQLLSGL